MKTHIEYYEAQAKLATEFAAKVQAALASGNYSSGASAGAAAEGKKGKKAKKVKDPNRPKRSATAYLLFAAKVRSEQTAEIATGGEDGTKMKPVEVVRMIGRQWQKIDPASKKRLEKKAEKLKSKYTAELVAYEAAGGAAGGAAAAAAAAAAAPLVATPVPSSSSKRARANSTEDDETTTSKKKKKKKKKKDKKTPAKE